MDFATFVKTYWQKVRRSGLPWTVLAIAEDSGLSKDAVDLLLAWLGANAAGLSDDAAIAKFTTSWKVVITPFGPTIQPLTTVPVSGNPAIDCITAIKADLARFGF